MSVGVNEAPGTGDDEFMVWGEATAGLTVRGYWWEYGLCGQQEGTKGLGRPAGLSRPCVFPWQQKLGSSVRTKRKGSTLATEFTKWKRRRYKNR